MTRTRADLVRAYALLDEARDLIEGLTDSSEWGRVPERAKEAIETASRRAHDAAELVTSALRRGAGLT